nr:hypothetical protein CFP56_62678 [Quercus suber]
MAQENDAIVKPRHFNIRDLILKRVSLTTRNPAHRKLGPNWEGSYMVINCKRLEEFSRHQMDAAKERIRAAAARQREERKAKGEATSTWGRRNWGRQLCSIFRGPWFV